MSETIASNDAPAATDGEITEAGDVAMDNLAAELGLDAPEPTSEELDALAEAESADEDGDSEKIKLKVNGKVVERTLKEVIEDAQKYAASNQKLEVAKREVEEARKLQGEIKSQQQAVRDLLGVMQRGDVATIAEFVKEKLGGGDAFDRACIQYAIAKYEESKMSPGERQARDNAALVAKYKTEAEARQRQDQQREFEFKVNEWSETINREVPAALQDVGLPDSEWVRSQVVSTWRAALEQGKAPTARAVAAYVKTQLESSGVQLAAPKAAAPPRPKATKESVSARRAPQQTEGYLGWDDWRANRGR